MAAAAAEVAKNTPGVEFFFILTGLNVFKMFCSHSVLIHDVYFLSDTGINQLNSSDLGTLDTLDETISKPACSSTSSAAARTPLFTWDQIQDPDPERHHRQVVLPGSVASTLINDKIDEVLPPAAYIHVEAKFRKLNVLLLRHVVVDDGELQTVVGKKVGNIRIRLL